MGRKKFERQPKRPASVDDGIKWLADVVHWRVKEFYKITGDSNRDKAGKWYDAYFAYEASRRLTRLLLWKARKHSLARRIKFTIRLHPPAMVDVRKSVSPEDLVRRQRQGPTGD